MNKFILGQEQITFQEIQEILENNLFIELSTNAREAIQHCRNYLDKIAAESEKPIYGVTTGFGSLCNRTISQNDLST